MRHKPTSWLGKIIGGVIGYIAFNIPGLVFGAILGHLFDSGHLSSWLRNVSPGNTNTQYVQHVFFNATFVIMGYLAKSDGHVSEREIGAARQVMRQMRLNEKLKREAIQCFYRGKRNDFNLQTALDELRQACGHHPSLLQTFLDIQIQMAQADGFIPPKKQAALTDICRRLGVQVNFNQNAGGYQRGQYQQNRQTHADNTADYNLLDIKTSATNAEVKQAYRKMMSKYHPDRLIAKGVPKEMIDMATQKTQQIKAAYERIKKHRNM